MHPNTSTARTRTPRASDDVVIEVDQLRRVYGGRRSFEAVTGVSFEVAEGELFALLGTNGAGKTSTLEVLEGLAAPTSGAVRVLGHDPLAERRAVRPRMGIMLQSGGFPQDLTVAETGRMWAGTLSGRPRTVAEALDMVSMAGRRDTPVRQLSGGERRRLDLAMALVGRPEVLFLDEPTTGLDPESRRDAWRLVQELRDAGCTVVLTTHYLEEAEALADHLAIMHRGEIVTAGTTEQVVAGHPSSISFAPLGPSTALPDLPGTVHRTEHGMTTLETHDLQPTLAALLRWAETEQVALHRLRAQSASLETVFLSIAGTDTNSPESPAGDPDHHRPGTAPAEQEEAA